MSSARASLLTIPAELRLCIFEYVFAVERPHGRIPTHGVRIRGNLDADEHPTIRNVLALRRVCRTVNAEVDQLISGVSAMAVELEDTGLNELSSWLDLIGNEATRQITHLDWKLSAAWHFQDNAPRTGLVVVHAGNIAGTVRENEPTACTHVCVGKEEIHWEREDMARLHDTGICRLRVDLERLHHDIATDCFPMTQLTMPTQSLDPYLMDKGYVQTFHCGAEDAHCSACARSQAQTLRRATSRLCDMRGNVALTKTNLLELCILGGAGRMNLEMLFHAHEG